MCELMVVRVTVTMIVPTMSTFLRMKDFHDVKIASQTEEGRHQHKQRLLNNFPFDDSMRRLDKQLHSNTPNNSNINQRP